MAERRMFSKTIIDSDLFLDMPASTQNLYFHLAMRADDDGFVNSPQKIMRTVSCSKNDMDLLIFKNYVIPFESGICVITHWKIHNYLRNDRYRPTIYTEEKNRLGLDESKTYFIGLPTGLPHGIPHVIPEDIPVGDAGKVRVVKDNKDLKDIVDANASTRTHKRFIQPTLEDVTAYCDERLNGVDAEKWYDHYTSNGWKVGKNPMKDWKAAVRTWEKTSTGRGSSTIGKTGQAARMEHIPTRAEWEEQERKKQEEMMKRTAEI